MPASVQTTILAGSLAGFSSTLLVHPLDVVRTKIQSSVVSCENPPTTFQVGERQRKRMHFYRYSLLQLAHSQNAAALAVSWLRGVASFQVMQRMVRSPLPPLKTSYKFLRPLHSSLQSLRINPISFYKGLSLPLAAQVVYKSAIFTLQNAMEKVGFSSVLSGCVAGGINALLFVTPVEFVR